jgi:hypothetical protein
VKYGAHQIGKSQALTHDAKETAKDAKKKALILHFVGFCFFGSWRFPLRLGVKYGGHKIGRSQALTHGETPVISKTVP